MSSVKQYTDNQLLERVASIGGTTRTGTYLLIGVQSQEDLFDQFDDKFYVFDGHEFKMVTTGTTNPGQKALKQYFNYDLPGAAVWKTDQFYKDLYKPGLHKGRMKALRQDRPIYYYRDSDKDNCSDQQGQLHHGQIYANQHGISYDPFSNKIATRIGGWSFACQVMNRMSDYKAWIKAAWSRDKNVDYAILKEW